MLSQLAADITCQLSQLVLQAFEPVDPWLDGVLRYGGGYSNWLPASSNPDRQELTELIQSYAKGVAEINEKSAGTDTCVWSPPPKMGLGCK